MWVQARISVIKAGEGPTCNTMQYLSPGPAVTEIDGPVFATTGVGTDLYAASQEAVRDGPRLSFVLAASERPFSTTTHSRFSVQRFVSAASEHLFSLASISMHRSRRW